MWEQTAFAGRFHATVFSCAAGARKPDPRLYQLIYAQLGVPPARCLYVGDGSGRELTGARQADMTPVLLCALHERDIVMREADPRQWDGPVIERIEQVMTYLNVNLPANDDIHLVDPTTYLKQE